MMRSFMTSGSVTYGTELDEEPDGSDTVSFPEKNIVMTIYGGRPSWGRCRIPSLSRRTPPCCVWGHGG
jgi:hypothetical protein